MGMRVETEVQRDLTFPLHTPKSGSPVSFGSLLMKRGFPLGGGGRAGAAGEGGLSSKPSVCLSEKKHCLLELGARGVRELVHSEVYPIVIHVEVTEKNVREIRRVVSMCACLLWKPLPLHLPPVCLSICVHACIVHVYCG